MATDFASPGSEGPDLRRAVADHRILARVDFDDTVGTYTFNPAEMTDYDVLELMVFGRTSGTPGTPHQEVRIRANGSSSSIYQERRYGAANDEQGISTPTTALQRSMLIASASPTDANIVGHGCLRFFGCRSAWFKSFEGLSFFPNDTGNSVIGVISGGSIHTTSTISSLTILLTSGNFKTGYAVLRGIA